MDKNYELLFKYNNFYLKGIGALVMQENAFSKICNSMAVYHNLTSKFNFPAINAIQENSLAIAKIINQQSSFAKMACPLKECNTLANVFKGYDFNMLNNNINIVSKIVNTPTAILALNKQQKLFSDFNSIYNSVAEKKLHLKQLSK